MIRIPYPTLLRIDAATCAALGLLLVVASGPVGALTALPAPLLLYVGLALLPIAGFMLLAAPRPALGGLAVAGNVAWVIASVALLLSGWIAPNALGTVFVAGQAVAVAGLAWAEMAALRQILPLRAVA